MKRLARTVVPACVALLLVSCAATTPTSPADLDAAPAQSDGPGNDTEEPDEPGQSQVAPVTADGKSVPTSELYDLVPAVEYNSAAPRYLDQLAFADGTLLQGAVDMYGEDRMVTALERLDSVIRAGHGWCSATVNPARVEAKFGTIPDMAPDTLETVQAWAPDMLTLLPEGSTAEDDCVVSATYWPVQVGATGMLPNIDVLGLGARARYVLRSDQGDITVVKHWDILLDNASGTGWKIASVSNFGALDQ